MIKNFFILWGLLPDGFFFGSASGTQTDKFKIVRLRGESCAVCKIFHGISHVTEFYVRNISAFGTGNVVMRFQGDVKPIILVRESDSEQFAVFRRVRQHPEHRRSADGGVFLADFLIHHARRCVAVQFAESVENHGFLFGVPSCLHYACSLLRLGIVFLVTILYHIILFCQ